MLKSKILLALVFSNLLVFTPAFADTIVSSDITSNTTWNLAGSPYIVTTDISIYGATGQTATLTIEPGVVVKFDPNATLFVGHPTTNRFGAINAQGTQANSIIFTANSATPASGSWEGIYFRDNTNDSLSTLNFCIVEYAGQTNNANVYISGASPTISNCTISHSSSYGIVILHTTSSPTSPNLNNNIYTDNSIDGIRITSATESRIWHSTTLTKDNAPYVIMEDLSTRDAVGGQTVLVTIQPGVEIRFAPGVGLVIWGGAGFSALDARGTAAEPIKFTSTITNPSPADYWDGVLFTDLARGNLTFFDHCIVEYTGQAGRAALQIENVPGNFSVTNSTFRNNTNAGIYSINTSPAIQSNIFSNNATAIHLFGSNSSTVSGNTIADSASYPVVLTHNAAGPNSPNLNNNTYTGNPLNGIQINSSYDSKIWYSTTLTKDNAPYVIMEDLATRDAVGGQMVLVTIQPGVEIRFAPGAGLAFWGGAGFSALDARGTAVEPITFTSNISNPTPLDYWDGLFFIPPSDMSQTFLKHCIIEYSGEPTHQAGLYFEDLAPQNLSFLTLRNGSYFGIAAKNSTVTAQYLNVDDNSLGGIKNVNNSSNIKAEYNWWADASGPSGAGPGTGQSVDTNVSFEPWSGEPVNESFYFFDADISPKTFNQHGDSALLQAQTTENANWQIFIKNNSNSIVKTFSGAGSSIAQEWAGDDNSNQPLANGVYTYTISAESTVNPGTTASLVGRLTLNDSLLLTTLITNNSVSERFFKRRLQSETSIQYTLDTDANVTVKIFDYKTNALVRTLVNNQLRTAATYADAWDGKNDSAQPLPEAVYTYTIDAQTLDGEAGRYDPPISGEPALVTNVILTPSPSFIPFNGDRLEVRYDLSAPALVNLGYKTNVLYVFEKPSKTTGNVAYWNGRNNQGAIVVDATRPIMVEAKAQRLPENFIVIDDDRTLDIAVLTSDPYLIRPIYNETTNITYSLNESATVTVKILSQNGSEVIKVLQQSVSKNAGTYSLTWDGRTTAGETVIEEADYRVRVEAVDSFGETTIRDGNIRVLY